MIRAKRPAGFTLVELMVVVVLVVLLGTVLFDRMMTYREQAEKSAVEQTLATIRSGLQLQFADRLLRGDYSRLKQLAEENPIDLLAEPPKNYGGVLAGDVATLEKGKWYFDKTRRELAYRPNLDGNLALLSGEKAIRYQILLLGNGPSETGSFTTYSGVRLVPVMRYKWF